MFLFLKASFDGDIHQAAEKIYLTFLFHFAK
jgi:hypothetical protein